ncbi:MAG: LeuA family protein [Acidobacteriota bacterium]
MAAPRPIRIIDATLREGCQAPGVSFDAERSVEIARALSRLGVDAVECGHPAASASEMERVRRVAHLGLDCPVLTHARACVDDVNAAAESGAGWVGIFLGINEVTRRARVPGMSIAQILDRITAAIKQARGLGLRVRYTLEDSSRTDESLMIQAFRAAASAGADRICFADTVGIAEPDLIASRVRSVKSELPDTELELHLHDDRGLAMANALAALDAGADWISTSVNGLGERAGILDLCLLLSNLSHRGVRPLLAGTGLLDLSTRVAAYARAPVDHRRPVTGRDAFTHTARLHVKAVNRDESAYSWISPCVVGRQNATANCGSSHSLGQLFLSPLLISAVELRHHREGPGTRYVMVDDRLVQDCRQYCIAREIPQINEPFSSHIDPHVHTVDSLFMFLGYEPGLTGLSVEVSLGDVVKQLRSPASVFIPAGTKHTYRILQGRGIFINHVLAGLYNESLLDSPE